MPEEHLSPAPWQMNPIDCLMPVALLPCASQVPADPGIFLTYLTDDMAMR